MMQASIYLKTENLFLGIDTSLYPQQKEFKVLLEKLLLNPYMHTSAVHRILALYPNSDTIQLHNKLDKEIHKAQHELERSFVGDRLIRKFSAWTKKFGDPGHYAIDLIAKTYPGIEPVFAPILYNTPYSIATYLKQFVKGQDQAVDQLSLVFYMHLLRCGIIRKSTSQAIQQMMPKYNCMLVGGTGTGKTYMLQKLSGLFDLPFIVINCASLVAEGYVGPQLSDSFTQLNIDCHRNQKYAVIVLDEFDKISSRYSGQDIKGPAIQRELLTLLQSNASLQIKKSFAKYAEKVNLDVSNMCFFFAGAYQGLDKLVDHTPMGYQTNPNKQTSNSIQRTHNALVQYGLSEELVGRIQNTIFLNSLTKQNLKEILFESGDSPIKSLQAYWTMHGQEFDLTDSKLEEVIDQCAVMNSGARGLTFLLLETYKSKMYTLANKSSIYA